jgi:ferredoxin
MLKVSLDQYKCVSSGQGVVNARDAFDQREEDGIVALITAHPRPDRSEAVRRAETLCPADAITVLD